MNKQEKDYKLTFRAFTFVVTAFLAASPLLQAQTQDVTVTIHNLAPQGGVYFTPVWLGFHDGSYDLFDRGGLASEALERLAEDGDAAALRAEFAVAVGDMGGTDDVVTAPEGFAGAPVFDPGDIATAQYTLDPTANQYASFISMIIPSNDAFMGNHNPHAIELFDAAGNFKGKQIITILGSMIWDAGTELNDEMDAAFINQSAPDTGTVTMCPVMPHPGYLGSYGNPGSPSVILGGTGPADIAFDAVAADFTLPYAVIARITIESASAEGSIGTAGFELLSNGRGGGPVIYVTSQGLVFDSIVKTDLPQDGPFQLLEMAGPTGLQTEFGPGDLGYVGGRWWLDLTGDGMQNTGDAFFMCPLLPPGRPLAPAGGRATSLLSAGGGGVITANGWYEGEEIYYILGGVEEGVTQLGQNDLYLIGGDRAFQANVAEFIPGEAGYSPHWNVNLVNTAPGTTLVDILASPYVSSHYPEALFDDVEDILAAQADGLVTIFKPGVVVLCPVISEQGAEAPGNTELPEEFPPFPSTF